MDNNSDALNYTEAVFDKLRAFVAQKTGIVIKDNKKEMLYNRTVERLKSLNIQTFDGYYDHLLADPREVDEYINAVTTNLSYFFREHPQFEALETSILPALYKIKDRISIWSAGCSTGQEPYCLAMVLLEYCRKHTGKHFSITATDLDTNVLAKAKQGVYDLGEMNSGANHRFMPLMEKYFLNGQGKHTGSIRVKDALREHITFSRLNLIDDSQKPSNVDIIFCRNVMIYFSSDTQKKLINDFYQSLNPGGFLLIGHSETSHNQAGLLDLGKKILQKK